MPGVKCPGRTLTSPLGESGKTSLAKSIPKCIPVCLATFHFHSRTRVWPYMLTKLVGGWLPLLVSVHSFQVGSKFSFWCPPGAHADRSPYLTIWLQTKNVLPWCRWSWTPHLRSKPLNMAMAWIKHEFIPLPRTWWSELTRATSFHSLPSAELQAYLMSTDIPFRTLTGGKKCTKSRHMSS